MQGVHAIILSIPFGKYTDLANLFDDVPDDVVVIDTSSYYPFRDGAIAEVDGGKPEKRLGECADRSFGRQSMERRAGDDTGREGTTERGIWTYRHSCRG